MIRSWAYNRFGVLMGTSSRASCPRWPSLRGNSWPMITLFSSQGDFCATASKPFFEIWQELNGTCVFELATGEHETYYSIQKVKTFTPPSPDKAFVYAQLAKNIENACIKARKYKLAAQRVV